MRTLIWLLSLWLILSPALADSSFVAPTATGTATTGQIPGTATNDSAATGNVGQYASGTLVAGSAISLSNGVAADLANTGALTAGDWDISATACFTPAASTNVAVYQVSVSATTNTLDGAPGSLVQLGTGGLVDAGNASCFAVGPVRVSTTGTPTYRVVVAASFTISTVTSYGIVRARRVR